MRYRKEFLILAVLALVIVAILLFVGYRPQTESPGDDTPLEHEAGGETPPELRQP